MDRRERIDIARKYELDLCVLPDKGYEFSDEQIRAIRNDKRKLRVIAKIYLCSPSHIWNIQNRKIYKHVPN